MQKMYKVDEFEKTEKRVKKKRRFLIVTALISAVAVAVSACAAKETACGKFDFEKPTVVLDPGHGGADGGVRGVDSGVYEREINLIIAKLVAERLKNAGYDVVLTRNDRHALYRKSGKTFKLRDFELRKEIIEKANPAAVVSIHCNKYSSPTRRGAQTFYDKRNANSLPFAEIMQNTLNAVVNAKYSKRNYEAVSGDFFIVNCTAAPAVIVECGFLSNPADDRLLNGEEYRKLIAYAVFSGITRYISLSYVGA